LALQVEAVKVALSDRATSRFRVRTMHGHSDLITISRDEYEEATEHLLGRTIDFTRDLIKQARHKGVMVIDDLLLVGGMARSPAVAQRLAEEFPDLPVARPPGDAEHIVARGAARSAARAASGPARDEPGNGRAASGPVTDEPHTDIPSVVNVTSKGYGVVVVRDFDRPRDGEMLLWMIKPNTEVPTRSHHVVRTVYDGQRRMKIHVYESTTDELTNNVEDHVRLIESRLDGLPAGRPKGYEVQVDFELGADGILRIRACAANGVALRLEVRIKGEMPPEAWATPLPGICP